MTIRYYILPIERSADSLSRGPKYFAWRNDPDPPGLTDKWSMKDYGSIDMAILVSDISDADHATLTANADVLAIPINIDNTLNTSARNTARNYLEARNIPGLWITTSMTYRTVLRVITGFFLYFQRVTAVLGQEINLPAGWMDLQVQQIPANIRSAMAQAANDMGYDYSAVTPTTTMRVILKAMADAWGSAPIYFGFATL